MAGQVRAEHPGLRHGGESRHAASRRHHDRWSSGSEPAPVSPRKRRPTARGCLSYVFNRHGLTPHRPGWSAGEL